MTLENLLLEHSRSLFPEDHPCVVARHLDACVPFPHRRHRRRCRRHRLRQNSQRSESSDGPSGSCAPGRSAASVAAALSFCTRETESTGRTVSRIQPETVPIKTYERVCSLTARAIQNHHQHPGKLENYHQQQQEALNCS